MRALLNINSEKRFIAHIKSRQILFYPKLTRLNKCIGMKVKQLQKVKVLPLLVSSPPSEKLRLLSISTPSSPSDLPVGQDRPLNFVQV